MEDRHKSLLQSMRMYLLPNLQPIVDDLVDRLYAVDILTENIKQTIEAQQTSHEKVRKLLDILPKRGPGTFKKFCNVLKDSKAPYIVAEFQKALGEPEIVPETYCQPRSEATASVAQQISVKDRQALTDEMVPIKGSQETTTTSTEPRHPEDKRTNGQGDLPTQPSRSTKEMTATGNQVPAETGLASSNRIDVQKNESNGGKQRQTNSTTKTSRWPDDLDLSLKYCSSIVIERGTGDKENKSNSQAYTLSASGTKLVVIVKNTRFDDASKLQGIENTDGDYTRLSKALEKLEFNVRTYTDQTKEELKEKLRNRAEADDTEAIILIIISYGGHKSVICKDGAELKISEIIETFSGKLQGKPKLIFLQTCGKFKGGAVLIPVEGEDLANVTDSMKCLTLTDGVEDMIVAKATHPYVSDGKDYSSLFLLALWDMLHQFYKDKHILELLEEVNKLKMDEAGKPMELCKIIYKTLTKDFYFFPPLPSQTLANERFVSDTK